MTPAAPTLLARLWQTRGTRLCLIALAAYTLAALWGEATYRLARWRDRVPTYNEVHEDQRYQPPAFLRVLVPATPGKGAAGAEGARVQGSGFSGASGGWRRQLDQSGETTLSRALSTPVSQTRVFSSPSSPSSSTAKVGRAVLVTPEGGTGEPHAPGSAGAGAYVLHCPAQPGEAPLCCHLLPYLNPLLNGTLTPPAYSLPAYGAAHLHAARRDAVALPCPVPPGTLTTLVDKARDKVGVPAEPRTQTPEPRTLTPALAVTGGSASAAPLFPLGSDNLGRDVLQRLLQGTRIAFHVGVLTSLIALPLGVLLGCLGGYFGGRTDSLVVWLCATVSSIPSLLLILAVSMVVGKGLAGVTWGIGLTTWVGICRSIRAEVIKHRGRTYVEAARVLGYSHARILLRHILPNVMHLVLISFSIRFPAAVGTEVFVSFLGIGVQGEPSWGVMLNNARLRLWQGVWWELTFVTLALFGLVLVFNVLADRLRDLLDPSTARNGGRA